MAEETEDDGDDVYQLSVHISGVKLQPVVSSRRGGSEHKSGESVHGNVAPEQLNADMKVKTAVAMLVETWSVIRSCLDEQGTGLRIED